MAVSIEIVLPTWLVAASLASLLAFLVWRTSGAERKGELVEPPEQPKDADRRLVIKPPERPKDELGAERKGELVEPPDQPEDAERRSRAGTGPSAPPW